MSSYGRPILLPETAPPSSVPLVRLDATHGYNESFIQELVFNHPEALPIDEIDRAFEGPVAVCRELQTPCGPIDCMYITDRGLPVIVECKLWRNPEARREVVGQILDYAKELGRWTYEDLQREVSRRLARSHGDALFDLVKKARPHLDEAQFVDDVSRNLRNGRFLLLIVGDGIREGVEKIAEYVRQHSGLHFTLGLVELPVFELPQGGRLVCPRVLARTTIVQRTVVELRGEQLSIREPEAEAGEESPGDANGEFYLRFWGELLSGLRLDARDQPIPNPSRIGNLAFRLPDPGGYNLWIVVYRSQKHGEVGVAVAARRDTLGMDVLQRLLADKSAINEELGCDPEWHDDDGTWQAISVHPYGNLGDPEQRLRVLDWLRSRVNSYVNVFRPRVKDIVDEL